MELHTLTRALVPDRREIDVADELLRIGVIHREIEQRFGGIESIDAAWPPRALVDEAEALAQHQQALPHQVYRRVAKDQTVDQVRLAGLAMRILLHDPDLVEQPVRR